MVIVSVVCANYIPKAKVLADSLKRHNPNVILVVGLVERDVHSALSEHPTIDRVLRTGDLGIPDFESFIFKYSRGEASMAVKGFLFLEAMRRFPEEDQFVYLDADIYVTAPLDDLHAVLSDHDIVLVPHLTEPESTIEGIRSNEIGALKHGVFNLGFLGIRRTSEGQRFLRWWSDRLHEFCYFDLENGLWADQRWVDLAPCFFEPFVFRHPGYDVACWNLASRPVHKDPQGGLRLGDAPLVFFHFSGWESGANEAILRRHARERGGTVLELREEYARLLKHHGETEFNRLPWSFGHYSDGSAIDPRHRALYGSDVHLRRRFPMPFDTGLQPSFRRVAIARRHFPPTPLPSLDDRGILRKAWDVYRDGGARYLAKRTLRQVRGR